MAVEQLPKDVASLLGKLSAGEKATVLNLHKKHPINVDVVEAYSMNNGGTAISSANFDAFMTYVKKYFEKKEIAKQKEKKGRPIATGATTTPTKRPGSGAAAMLAQLGHLFADQATPIADQASPPASLPQGSPPASLPQGSPPAKRQRDEGTPMAALAASPLGTPSQRLQMTPNASFGNSDLTMLASDKDRPVTVRSLGDAPARPLYRWMNEPPEQRANALDERLLAFGPRLVEELQAQHGQEIPCGAIGNVTQSEVAIFGRVACEGLEGKLNEWSLLLEGPLDEAVAVPRVQLSVSSCPSLAVTPGQIVGVIGRTGMSGQSFHAQHVTSGLAPQASSSGPEHAFQMVVAAGPYCLQKNLDFSPLTQLLARMVEKRPQVLVLMGPFLDANNAEVASGAPKLPGQKDSCTYQELYTEGILPLLARGLAPLREAKPPTEVIIVPSLEEVLCLHPLPQPPLDVSLFLGAAAGAWQPLRDLGVQLVSNPSHLNIGGLRVSLTSADALTPVLRDLVLRPVGNKIEEGLRMLARQRSLFPVVPREPAHVSEEQAGALNFPEDVTPDVVLFPSQMGAAGAHFIDGAVFVNPGRFCRGVLGTFAELSAKPREADQSLEQCLRVDIQKLAAEA